MFNINVHAPFAVIVPDIVVFPPLQRVTAALVIAATGRVFTVTATVLLLVQPLPLAVVAVAVYVVVVVGVAVTEATFDALNPVVGVHVYVTAEAGFN